MKKTGFYQHCTLCPRNCGVNRRITTGYCKSPAELRAARAGLHFYEEPFLSGTQGSGTMFFSGCSLGCIYCQNTQISHEGMGFPITEERLAEIFLEQQGRGAHNINLVTGTHYTPSIAKALRKARADGLHIPVVWNSSGYEKPETLRMLEGLVDIFLPDFKTLSPELGQRYMKAPDYGKWVKEALAVMVKMTGDPVFEEEHFSTTTVEEIQTSEDCIQTQNTLEDSNIEEYPGETVLLKRGVVVRHMMIPGQLEDSKAVVRYLWETFGDHIWMSLMSQYTPVGLFAHSEESLDGNRAEHPGDSAKVRSKLATELPQELFCRVSEKEYDALVDYAISLGIENCMIQEGDVASDSFIPAFDGTGILE